MNPFPLTSATLQLIASCLNDAVDESRVSSLIVAILLVMSWLGPCLVVDLCFFLPWSIISLLVEENDGNSN